MHQKSHQHVFTPILHQSSTVVPAPTMMGTQDRNLYTHLPRQTPRPSFTPVTAFHRGTQKSCRSTTRGRWGALHVGIAWKIYYHKLKQRQLSTPNPSLLDLLQHKESQHPSSVHSYLDSPCGHSAYGNVGDRSRTGKTDAQMSHNRSCPSDLHTSSLVSRHGRATKRKKLDCEKLDRVPNLHWKEKPDEEKHRSCQTDTIKDSSLRDKSWDPRVIPELDGRHGASLDKKRQLECDSFIKVKRLKQESIDGSSKTLHSDPSPFIRTHAQPSSHTVRVQHVNIGDLSVLYPGSSACNVSYPPFVKLHPYQTAYWEPMWDMHKRMDLHFTQNVLSDYSTSTCKAIRIPVAAQRQKEAFHRFFTPPLHVPLAWRQQETVRGREVLASREPSSPLQMSTSYLGP